MSDLAAMEMPEFSRHASKHPGYYVVGLGRKLKLLLPSCSATKSKEEPFKEFYIRCSLHVRPLFFSGELPCDISPVNSGLGCSIPCTFDDVLGKKVIFCSPLSCGLPASFSSRTTCEPDCWVYICAICGSLLKKWSSRIEAF